MAIADDSVCRTISFAPFGCVPEAVTRHRWARKSFSYTARVKFQTQLLDYIKPEGLLVPTLLRLDESMSGATKNDTMRRWSPVHIIDSVSTIDYVHVYPPAVLLHGEEDTVPIEQSKQMAQRLRARNVPVLEVYEPLVLVPHAFDQLYLVGECYVCFRPYQGIP